MIWAENIRTGKEGVKEAAELIDSRQGANRDGSVAHMED